MASTKGPQAPLKNIRVLDLSRVFAMPFAGANLADLGAEVIKVDTCQTQFMDTTRTITGPFPDNEPGEYWWEQGGTFQNLNRGKRSLTLDLRSEKSQKIIKELINSSVENQARPAILIFKPHPRQFFSGNYNNFNIITENSKISLLEKLGIAYYFSLE